MKQIFVTKDMLSSFGNMLYGNEDGNLCIVCDGVTSRIEEIFIKACLEDFDKGYKIIETNDYIWEDVKGEEHFDIEFVTNYPWIEYQKEYMFPKKK